ncbi:hypothetical protein EDM53_01310 [Rickettsiales endosymbiont of Peranema trichophorum]|nr:hypothetical protein EDM53_01310 [Rickettsiales endosymbiont of Peranema trichophorum]
MIMVGFQGTSTDDQDVKKLLDDIKNGYVSGVILYKYNIESEQQVMKLTQAFKAAAAEAKVPIFIGIDQ